MLNKNLKFILILVASLVFPIKGWGGAVPAFFNAKTDDASFQLYYVWDLRNRDSYFQVFNTSELQSVTVHIQVFDATDGTESSCEIRDYYDTYTPRDTHVYNLRNLDRNNGHFLFPPFPADGFGFVVVTVVTGEEGVAVQNPVLIGNFRIIDNAGYEYRSNAAGYPNTLGEVALPPPISTYSFNFNNADGKTFADVVGIAVFHAGPGPGFNRVIANPTYRANFDEVTITDENEDADICPPVTFACGAGADFDLGIDTAVKNSKGVSVICPESHIEDVGFVKLEETESSSTTADFFVGFIGLNNGGRTGSMDSFTAVP